MKFILVAAIFLTCNSAVQNQNIHADSSVKDSFQIHSDNSAAADTSLEGSWQLQPVLASDTASGRLPRLNFDLSKGQFTGNTGCNGMRGSFTVQDDNLTFNQDMVTTKMACPGYNEKAFVENLHRTTRFKIRDGVLQLMNNNAVISKWVRPGNLKENKI